MEKFYLDIMTHLIKLTHVFCKYRYGVFMNAKKTIESLYLIVHNKN